MRPALPLVLLRDRLWSGWFECAKGLGVVAVITNWRLMDAALIRRLHENGWRVLAYTLHVDNTTENPCP